MLAEFREEILLKSNIEEQLLKHCVADFMCKIIIFYTHRGMELYGRRV